MTTEVVAVDPDRPDPATLDRAAAIIRSGGLVAFGTETVYGLGADATNAEAVARIFAAKGRPSTNPLIVHVADAAGARACVASWPEAAATLAARFWPGPLTLVLPRAALMPHLVTAGQGTVGIRVPAPPVARELIRRAGVPIAAPSANRSNRISPTRAEHVRKDLDGLLDLILDSGPCAVGIESTVLDLSGEHPTILRPGAISAQDIAAIILGPVAQLAGSIAPGQVAASPGQLAVHYAPSTPAYRIAWSAIGTMQPAIDRPQKVATICLGEPPEILPGIARQFVVFLDDPIMAAARLYDMMHRLDARSCDFLLIITPPDDELGWEAVLDRVRRATRPWGEVAPSG